MGFFQVAGDLQEPAASPVEALANADMAQPRSRPGGPRRGALSWLEIIDIAFVVLSSPRRLRRRPRHASVQENRQIGRINPESRTPTAGTGEIDSSQFARPDECDYPLSLDAEAATHLWRCHHPNRIGRGRCHQDHPLLPEVMAARGFNAFSTLASSNRTGRRPARRQGIHPRRCHAWIVAVVTRYRRASSLAFKRSLMSSSTEKLKCLCKES